MGAGLVSNFTGAPLVSSAQAFFHTSLFGGNKEAGQDQGQGSAVLPEWMDSYEAGLALADLQLLDKNGKALELSDDKIYVVNFWARWCGPCIAEMPSLAELARSVDDKGVEIIAASTLDGKPEAVEAYIARQTKWDGLNYAYPPAPDITNRLGARGLPATVIFDKQGNGVAQHFAPADWAAEDIKQYLTALAK